jgi:1-acyl-sn-glycerol-3-phosphate acyltransferase
MLRIKKKWSFAVIKIVGIDLKIRGKSTDSQVYVSNHVSWIDILILNYALDIVFVAKKEVKSWVGIGLLAVLAKTIFIDRKSLSALKQKQQIEKHLRKGHSICFFPEGTSTDGMQVNPFKSSLFSICFSNYGKKDKNLVQPLTIKYFSPFKDEPSFYSFWKEEETIFENITKIVSSSKIGSVKLILHEPITGTLQKNRKSLAVECQKLVSKGLKESY